MDVHKVVANAQRRKDEIAMQNELDVHALRQKNEAFQDLITNLGGEFVAQVATLQRNPATNTVKITRENGRLIVFRTDSAKTLTILFSPNFHTATFAYEGGSVFKRTLRVEIERGQVHYRRENGVVVRPDISSMESLVSEMLDTLLQ